MKDRRACDDTCGLTFQKRGIRPNKHLKTKFSSCLSHLKVRPPFRILFWGTAIVSAPMAARAPPPARLGQDSMAALTSKVEAALTHEAGGRRERCL